MRAFLLLLTAGLAAAEDGINGWLRYASLPTADLKGKPLPNDIIALNATKSSPVYTAGQELQKGIQGITGKKLNVGHTAAQTSGSFAVVGTVPEYRKLFGNTDKAPALEADGFFLDTTTDSVKILGQNERGALYGAFEYLSMLAQNNFTKVAYASNPDKQVRWVNQWDNMDGSIERGYGGPSMFFENGLVMSNLTRASGYARLLSSLGLNGCVVNNVNANSTTLTPENIEGLGRIADQFRPYGIQLGLSLDFASPEEVGGLKTYDPLDPAVISFWTNITDQIYEAVPDMAGYLVKADSEGQPGPLTYNRTLAEGANLFAKPLMKYGGIVMFRAFVYNQLNESDWKADRANAAVDFFKDLDGKFDDNVVVQIKYGPIDFQVREPTSPLFANMPKTSLAIELQVTPEYLGQNTHLVYLPPLWQTVLDFDLRYNNQPSLVRDIITGKRFNRPLGGIAGVVGAGTNTTWLGSHLAMSNLYAFGRLAWDGASDPETSLQDWTRLTFGLDKTVLNAITTMSMASWPAYENYSGNLGIQTLTNITGNHYSAGPQSQDNDGWGQWTRADGTSIGMDRTVWNGTGFSGQYPDEVYQMYENKDTTPDNLLLWFHHVNYTEKLKSGKTVVQHFYDAHYAGAETAQTFPTTWQTLNSKVDSERYSDVLNHLTYQAGHSIVWRDAIVNWIHNMSGIADSAKRVGHHPYRIEAEAMTLDGYEAVLIQPFEDASNYTAIHTTSGSTQGTATAKLNFPSGTYSVAVNYFDVIGGRAQWQVYINNKMLGEWVGNMEDTFGHAPSPDLDSTTAVRKTFPGIKIAKGDTLKIVGKPDGIEWAGLDYVAILPAGVLD